MEERKSFSGWAYITRAEDVEGCWLARCPDYSITTYGGSPEEAYEMIRDAVGVCLADDLSHGLDPNGRRSEDPEDWAPLLRIFERHTQVPVSGIDSSTDRFKEFAIQFTLVFRPVASTSSRSEELSVEPDGSINVPAQSALMAA